MNVRLLGLGTALPDYRMSQQDALQMTHDIVCGDERQRRLATMLFRKSGVSGRNTAVPHPIAYEWAARDESGARSRGPTTAERMRLYARHAPDLAARACQQALAAAGVPPAGIGHLITVSCTGFDAPGFDIQLFNDVGLAQTTQRMQIGFMGCHGAINGLRAARGLACADPEAHILLCACELCSLHYRFAWDDEGVIGNALFADGAAAAVVSLEQSATPLGNAWHVVATGSCLIPDSQACMSWRIGDYGFEMRLTSEVPELIERSLRPWLEAWLGQHRLTVPDVDHWIIHPGGPRILDAAERALELTPRRTELSRTVLEEQGNMSSPTVLFVLQRLDQMAARGSCVLLGFGPGLMAETCLLRR